MQQHDRVVQHQPQCSTFRLATTMTLLDAEASCLISPHITVSYVRKKYTTYQKKKNSFILQENVSQCVGDQVKYWAIKESKMVAKADTIGVNSTSVQLTSERIHLRCADPGSMPIRWQKDLWRLSNSHTKIWAKQLSRKKTNHSRFLNICLVNH
jgi:hypothetical protein